MSCREVLHHALVHPNVNVREYLENDPEAYYSKDELLEPLTLIYNSLLMCGDKYIAHGRLLDCIRQVTNPCSRCWRNHARGSVQPACGCVHTGDVLWHGLGNIGRQAGEHKALGCH